MASPDLPENAYRLRSERVRASYAAAVTEIRQSREAS
jgi:hypothetical protein